MQIQDRVVELRRVRAGSLRPHPKNWRTHPTAQRDALKGLLAEVGFAGALLARETEDGALELIDGHLRAETTPEAIVPVLVLDVSAEEAEKILATHDPLAAMAGANRDLFAAVLADVQTNNEFVRAMLDELRENLDSAENSAWINQAAPHEIELAPSLQLVVECDDEEAQRELFERLSEEGFRCRVLTL